jgi:hypothetical protein
MPTALRRGPVRAHVGHTTVLSPIPKADPPGARIVAAVFRAFHIFGAKGPGRIAMLDLAGRPLPTNWLPPLLRASLRP